MSQNPFARVVGQSKVVDQLQAALSRPLHAYLFVGPPGSGKRIAARAFASALVDDARALEDRHPDVSVIEREGASISVAQAREIARLAARSPVESERKVLILNEFHLVDEAAPALLKTLEEASPTTVFIVIADHLTSDLTTIASRCIRIEFSALDAGTIERTLVDEGVDGERARLAACSSFGNIDRARLLAVDDDVVARRELWLSIPSRLDGTGTAAARMAAEVVTSLDHASRPLLERQSTEQKQAAQRAKETGQPASFMKTVEARHKRERRRLRTDELKAGFATLAQVLGRRLQDMDDVAAAAEARRHLDALETATGSLTYNPNEALLLQGLFVKLSPGVVPV